MGKFTTNTREHGQILSFVPADELEHSSGGDEMKEVTNCGALTTSESLTIWPERFIFIDSTIFKCSGGG